MWTYVQFLHRFLSGVQVEPLAIKLVLCYIDRFLQARGSTPTRM